MFRVYITKNLPRIIGYILSLLRLNNGFIIKLKIMATS